MKIEVKIHKLALSTPMKSQEVIYNYKDLPGFRYLQHIDTKGPVSNINNNEIADSKKNKYENVNRFEHVDTGKFLTIYNLRKRHKIISPVYMFFSSEFYHNFTYYDVYGIEKYFKQMNIPLYVSEIHLALDIIKKTQNGLYHKIIMSLKPGSKRRPNNHPKLQHETCIYFGELSSGNYLVVYDKGEELRSKYGIAEERDICRIELRMKMHKMNNYMRSIHTIDDLATYDWSFVYGRFYSFHHRCKELKQELRDIGEDWQQPIWDLRDIMLEKCEVYPSNFYRDYLIDHPVLSVKVRKALAEYRWCADYNRYKNR
jgi:hypothetical protein